MNRRIYFSFCSEVQQSMLYAFRFLFYAYQDGDLKKILTKKIHYLEDKKQLDYLDNLFAISDINNLETGIFRLTQYYKNYPHLINEASLFSLNEYIRTNNLIPASGDMDNSSDTFLHLVPYSIFAYVKEGKFVLDREEVYNNIVRISNLTHANMRVTISHTIFFALLVKIYEYRVKNNGKTLKKKQVANIVDESLRKVLYHYRDYQYLNDLRYFVRLDKQLFDRATTIVPSHQILKINAKELRAGNYVIDTIETLLYALLKYSSYEEGIKFIADIPGVSHYNLMLFTLLHPLAYGSPPLIKNTFSSVENRDISLLNASSGLYFETAFYPIKALVDKIVTQSALDEKQIELYAKQIAFEFSRLGFAFSPLCNLKFKIPNGKLEAYYQLYCLIKTVRRFDSVFIGQLALINNIIK